MSTLELYVSRSTVFAGSQTSFEKAGYAVIGVPFDATSTYRTGARFAPRAIREASLNIETYSFHSNLDVEDLDIHDLGDLHVSGDVERTLRNLECVIDDLAKTKKTLVLIGGEHTLTLGAMRSIGGRDTAVVSLDAHLDLRDQYMDMSTSHTTFLRRLNEEVTPDKIVEIGTRAVCKEELAYAKKVGVQNFTAKEIQELGCKATVRKVKKAVEDFKRIYVSIDMDVLDPAFAPAVQNPEPDGLSIRTLLEFVEGVCDSRTVCLDLVEVTPHYDNGITSIQAAKIIFEALCQIEKTRRN